jgi:ABC-type oligopeptide transport system substrate-binding subunit
MPRILSCVGLLLLIACPAWADHGIAMHGKPKYAAGFKHFGYVNPKAPKSGALRLGVVGTFDSLNPFIVRENGAAAPAFSLFSSAAVYETLLARSWDEPFSLYGLLAESVETPEDRSSVTFILRPEARWNDGKPVTIEDVLFSFETLRDQGRPNHRTYYKKVEKIERFGERGVRFSFKKNTDGSWDREMPLIMGLMPILPKHDWQDRPFNQTTLRPPVASGPYKITQAEAGRSMTLTRNPDYWATRRAPARHV